MPHLDKKKPGCAKAILKQESGEKEWVTSLMLFYVFGHGPQERFGFPLYTGFFSPAALKKQNPAQTLWQHQRNSNQFVVKQPFNNMIFHMQAQVKFLASWRNLHVWLQREQRSPRRVSCSTAPCGAAERRDSTTSQPLVRSPLLQPSSTCVGMRGVR